MMGAAVVAIYAIAAALDGQLGLAPLRAEAASQIQDPAEKASLRSRKIR